jgi:hypothetical protein
MNGTYVEKNIMSRFLKVLIYVQISNMKITNMGVQNPNNKIQRVKI